MHKHRGLQGEIPGKKIWGYVLWLTKRPDPSQREGGGEREREKEREYFSLVNRIQKGQVDSNRNGLTKLKADHISLSFRWHGTLPWICIGLVIASPAEGGFLASILVKPTPQIYLFASHYLFLCIKFYNLPSFLFVCFHKVNSFPNESVLHFWQPSMKKIISSFLQ